MKVDKLIRLLYNENLTSEESVVYMGSYNYKHPQAWRKSELMVLGHFTVSLFSTALVVTPGSEETLGTSTNLYLGLFLLPG